MRRVGYLGPKGTFTEEASRKHFSDQEVEWQTYSSIFDVLNAVAEGEVDNGVVPIENSIEGSVNMTVDGLVQYPELFVEAEIVLPITQNLLTIDNAVTLEDIREIWSHPQALAQCSNFIQSLGVKIKPWDSTAAAAMELAKTKRRDVAAIGTSLASTMFSLYMLQPNLQDYTENHTRFVVFRRGAVDVPAANKTMLHIVMEEDHAGALVHVLNLFAAVNLNLSRIESRPTRKKLGTYQFFIDVEEGAGDENVQKVIQIIGTVGHQVRVLGSYKQNF